jgi:hypothetical protein
MRVSTFSLIVLISMLTFASALAAPRQQTTAATCTNNNCQVFLPLVLWQIHPTLVSPTDNLASGSLAPVLSWSPATHRPPQIQVSSDPSFVEGTTMPVNYTKRVRNPIPAQIDTAITSNLKGNTTYFWRVGAPDNIGGHQYSTVRTFTTPPKDSSLLPSATNILAPKDNAVIKGSTVLLQWQSVVGATNYRIKMYDATGKTVSSDELGGAENRLLVEDLPLGTYYWKVKVINSYGWGDYSPEFYFKLY